ncbi:hypothetical protein NDU88_003062 [Pleurodeles waltl]|uniref:Uncharacterized protein n=1 Tax=Pleurodeles waltl TaxID=8319 RepID=A0AAV7RC45_PLEWA|nr:hypothetical protein NDU88_003062 [Pleurodeles waltl]
MTNHTRLITSGLLLYWAIIRGIPPIPVWGYLDLLCSARAAAVCTLVFVTVRCSASRFHFPRFQGSGFLYWATAAPRTGDLPGFLSPRCTALAARRSCRSSGRAPGPLLFVLAGTEPLPSRLVRPAIQSRHARARTVTTVPGFRVGLQAAGASLLCHLQREPLGAQGSVPGSPSGPQLHTCSGNVDGT